MSTPAYLDIAQLRFWSEAELRTRDLAQTAIVACVNERLTAINAAWTFHRMEGPTLTPRSFMSAEYSDADLWTTPASLAGEQVVLRAETTPSTYAYIRATHPKTKQLKLPKAFWQIGKSYRREAQATAGRLRFFEFTQLELQCLYSVGTKADYQAHVLPALADTLSWLCRAEARVIESDRLPHYSQKTMDIEVRHLDAWREVASISVRTDFDPDILNLEVAVGMDRVVAIHHAQEPSSL